MWNFAFFVIMAVVAVCIRVGTFTVYEGQQVVITQLGRIIGEPYQEPGLYFRAPFIQRTNYFDARIETWEGYVNYVPTKDKLYVAVETVAHWRIINPARFLESLGDVPTATAKLDSILNGAVKDTVSGHALVDTVRNTNRIIATHRRLAREEHAKPHTGHTGKLDDEVISELEKVTVGREHLARKMLNVASAQLEPLGVEVLNVLVKKISYEPAVELMVYERMKSERERVAERLLSMGRSERERIRGKAAKDAQEVLAPAVRSAEEIKGRADAEAIKVYGESFGKDENFYRFWRSLMAYRHALPEKAELIGATDTAFFDAMRGFTGQGATESAALSAPVLQAPAKSVETTRPAAGAGGAVSD